MIEEVCSYCQRPYGSRGTSGKYLYKTFDHIEPLYWPKKDKTRNSNYETYTLEQLQNIIDCCQECNKLKGHDSLGVFVLRAQSKYSKKISTKVTTSVRILQSSDFKQVPISYLI